MEQNVEGMAVSPNGQQTDVSGSTIFNFKPMPISIVINSGSEELGRFYEVDGLLTFEGKVDEAGQMFVDFVGDLLIVCVNGFEQLH